MNKYTVLLVIPDYAAENYGQDIGYYHVEAPNTSIAAHKAQIQMSSDLDLHHERDAYCAFIFRGFIKPLVAGEPVEDIE